MSSQRYERVSANDEDTPITPTSPPPSFRSRGSSPTSRHTTSSRVDQNLADTFDADGSDSDEDNDGDDRQRLMRGTPNTSSSSEQPTPESTSTSQSRPAVVETRSTYLPAFAPPARGATSGRVYGGGSGSDGVFANLSAKPEPGEKTEEHPPTYEQAAADAAPPYWETTILAPGLGGPDDVYVEGLPVGSLFSFIWNAMISMSFQLVGFLLTYLLHTTHAAKNGSRAGLGITLVQYGFYMRGNGGVSGPPNSDGNYAQPPDPNSHNFNPDTVGQAAPDSDSSGGGIGDIASSDWIAYALMIAGWFILIKSVSDYLRARRMEQLVLQSPDRGLGTPVVAEGERSETVV